METNIKDKIVIKDSNREDKELLIRYKLLTIIEDDEIIEEELGRINRYIIDRMNEDIGKYKILYIDDKIIGAYLVREGRDGLLLDEIYIEDMYRGYGIGSYIIEKVLSEGKIVYLWVYKRNKRAIKLYRSLGFKVLEETESRYFMRYEEKKMKVLLFTHEQDIDGMGNVILCRKAFSNFDYVTCKTFEVNKNVQEKIDDESIYSYDYIFVTDICIKEPLLKRIDEDERLKGKIIVLDHHKSEIEEGNDKYDWVHVIVSKEENKCSGTSLFYEYLMNKGYLEYDETIDELVELTRQYDTWEWKDKYNNDKARKLHILFEVLGYERYIKIMDRIVDGKRGVVFNEDEKDIIEKFDKDLEKEVKNIIEGMKVYEVVVDGVEYRIGYVRCFYKYRNDINEFVMNDNKNDIDLVGMIMLDMDTVSYRLVKDVDASKVAVYFGGKGHKAASSNPQDNEKFLDIMKGFVDDEYID